MSGPTQYAKDIQGWVMKPFSVNMSVWGWIIFISLVAIIAYAWRGAVGKLLSALDIGE